MYINNRGFPGGGKYPPGPIGYIYIISTEATTTVLNVMFPLNQWLADGLLVGPISNLVAWVFNVGHPPAAPLLRHLLQELLGHGLPMPVVPYLCRYVLKSPSKLTMTR